MKYLLILSMLFSSAYAQIKLTENNTTTIGKVKSMSEFIAELNYSVAGTDTTYTLIYADYTYKILEKFGTVSFTGSRTLNDLYDIMKKGTDAEFSLGKSKVTIKAAKFMGAKSVALYVQDEYGIISQMKGLTSKQIDKLFAK